MLIEVNKKEIQKQKEQNLFLLAELLSKNHTAKTITLYLPSILSAHPFYPKNLLFLIHPHPYYSIFFLFIAKQFIIFNFLSYFFPTTKALLFACNSYAFTLQLHCFYTPKAMFFSSYFNTFKTPSYHLYLTTPIR